ncbi:MAG: MFS transporter [Alphaproteobacteria bacterium]
MNTVPQKYHLPLIVIASACLISVLTFGIRAGFGLFSPSIAQEYSWPLEIFSLSFAIQNILWGAALPLAGMVADKFGSARTLAAGGAIFAAGLAMMTISTTPTMMHLSAGFLVGLGMAGASFSVLLASVSRLVAPEKRPKIMGVVTAAGSLGQFLVVPIGHYFLTTFGWKTALLLFALMALSIIPLAAAIRGKGTPMNAADTQTLPQALGEAFRHSSYLWLTAGFFTCGFQLAFVTFHLPKFLADNNVPEWVGAYALALIGLFNIAGSLVAGNLATRFSKRWMLTWIYFLRSIMIAIYLLLPITATSTLIFASAMGLLWLSTVPPTSGLVAHMFGVRYMASLFGFVFFSHQLGSFAGVWLGGYLRDATGSYNSSWWIGAALGIFAALVHLPIKEAPVPRLAKAS